MKKGEELLFIKEVALQTMEYAFSIADLTGKIIYVNNACIKFLGYKKELEIVGKHISEFSDSKVPINNVIASVQKNISYTGEDSFVKKDGTLMDFQVKANLIKSKEGTPVGIMAFFIDTTEKNRTEKILSETQDRFERLINQSNDVIWRCSLDGEHLLDLNDSFEIIYGCPNHDFYANPKLWIEMVHPDDRKIAEESGIELMRNISTIAEYRIVRPDGEIRWLLDRKSIIYDKTGNPIEIGGFATDITKYKELEEEIKLTKETLEQKVKEQTVELKESHDQLRALTTHLHDILEAERMSIARDIHDELGHLLTVIKIEIEDLVAPVNKLKKSYSNKLNPVIDLVDAAIDSVRTIATKLRPEVLDYFGLIPAMEWQIQQFQIKNKIELKHDFELKDFPFGKNESTAIFRIFQEILTNILRHSKAKNIEILFKNENEHIILKVKDNGTGFDMSQTAHEHSFGLLGMKERALSIGGELIIESIPGTGTTISLFLPGKYSVENRDQRDD